MKEGLLKWSNDFVTKDMSMKTTDEMCTEFKTALKSHQSVQTQQLDSGPASKA